MHCFIAVIMTWLRFLKQFLDDIILRVRVLICVYVYDYTVQGLAYFELITSQIIEIESKNDFNSNFWKEIIITKLLILIAIKYDEKMISFIIYTSLTNICERTFYNDKIKYNNLLLFFLFLHTWLLLRTTAWNPQFNNVLLLVCACSNAFQRCRLHKHSFTIKKKKSNYHFLITLSACSCLC